MNLYMKQKIFTLRDKFSIYDENGNERYYVQGEILSVGKKLHIYDCLGNEIALLRQKLLTFLPKYRIIIGGNEIAEVEQKFTVLRRKFRVLGLGWEVKGDIFDHEYSVESDRGETLIRVSKEWFTFGDAYQISVSDNCDELTALCVVLTIDAIDDHHD